MGRVAAVLLLVLLLFLVPWLPDQDSGVPPLRLSVDGSGTPASVATMVVTQGHPNLVQIVTGFALRSPMASRTWADTGAGDLDARWTAYRAELVAAEVSRREVATAAMVVRSGDDGLRPGDIVISVDGRHVDDVEGMLAAWYAAEARAPGAAPLVGGYPVAVSVRRDTELVATTLSRPWTVAVSVVAARPAVIPALDGVTGNSMGLATVLAVLDAASPAHPLIGGAGGSLAVTGALTDAPHGAVPSHRLAIVGHVADKAAAAVTAGFTRLMVPADQLADARAGIGAALAQRAAGHALGPRARVALPPGRGRGGVELVGVRTVEEAVSWLCAQLPDGAAPPVCSTAGVQRARPPRTQRVLAPPAIGRMDGARGP